MTEISFSLSNDIADKNFDPFSLLQLCASIRAVSYSDNGSLPTKNKYTMNFSPGTNGANTIKISEYHAQKGQ